MKEENFEHFGIEFNSNEIKKYLNRENFAIINTACENNECIRYRREHWDYFEKIRDNINIDDYSINIWPPSYKYCMEDGTLRLSDEFCKKYQEASLKELSEIISLETGKKITKSGLNHRFRKIKELALKFLDN